MIDYIIQSMQDDLKLIKEAITIIGKQKIFSSFHLKAEEPDFIRLETILKKFKD